jgi:Cu2+-exporting ATPase
MSCCAPGTEGAVEAACSAARLPSSRRIAAGRRDLGDEGLRQSDLSVPGVHCGTCITTIEGRCMHAPTWRARV